MAEPEVASPPGVIEVPMPVEVEVPLGPGAAEVPILAEVAVPLGPGAATVSMAAAEPGGGEVLLRPTAPPSLTPPSSMLHPFLARPFPTYCIHKQRTNPTQANNVTISVPCIYKVTKISQQNDLTLVSY
jgi:hypothetical protein